MSIKKNKNDNRMGTVRLWTLALCGIGGWLGAGVTTAWAGPPVPFNGYTVTNGVINAPCPATAISCSGVVTDNGFLQREVQTASGTYVQFILTDPGVTGSAAANPFTVARGSLNFTNEDFVQMGNRTTGIASEQAIYAATLDTPTTEDQFENVTQYLFGWAQNSPEPWVDIHQSITTADYSLSPTNPTETFGDVADIVSSNTSFSTDQDIGLAQYINLGGTDAQKFLYQEVSGIYQTTSHPGDASVPTPLLPGGTNGGDFTWENGNSLAAVWVGQAFNDPGFEQVLGYTHYQLSDNNGNPFVGTIGPNIYTTANDQTAYVSFTNANPVNWITNWLSPNPPPQAPPYSTDDTISGPETVNASAQYLGLVPAPTGLVGTGDTAVVPTGSYSTAAEGPPTGFNQWTVTGGTITPTLDPTAPVDVSGAGLLQRFVTIGGAQYIQTVVTDTTATGNPNNAAFSANSLGFSNESFVKMGQTGAEQGVSSNLNIAEQDLSYQATTASHPLPFTGGDFTYSAVVNSGWAGTSIPVAQFAGGAGGCTADGGAVSGGNCLLTNTQIQQRTYVPDNIPPTSTSMDQTFTMAALGNNSNNRDMQISSVVGTNATANQTDTIPINVFFTVAACLGDGGTVVGTNCQITQAGTGFVQPVVFATDLVEGIYQTSTHQLTDPALLPPGVTTQLPSGAINYGAPTHGGNVAWNPGDSIQATYVGGEYTASDPAGDSIISSTSFTNLSTGQRTMNADLTTPQPIVAVTNVPNPGSTAWDEYFGPVPSWTNPYVAPPEP